MYLLNEDPAGEAADYWSIIEYTCCIDGIIYNIVALQYFIYQYYTPFHFEL